MGFLLCSILPGIVPYPELDTVGEPKKRSYNQREPGKEPLLEERKCKFRASWSKDASKERESMSLQRSRIPPIPPETVLVAKAAFPKGACLHADA